jgi:hypothetical protein
MTPSPRRILPLILLAASLLLSGCVDDVVSVQPLSSPKTATPDSRLEGLWRAKDGSGYDYFAFGRHAGQGNGANLLLKFGSSGANSPENDQIGWSNSMNFFVTRTKNHRYLNMSKDYERYGGDNNPRLNQDDYVFLEYHFSKRGDLLLSTLSNDFFTKAINDKKLRGEVIDESFIINTSYPYLTDSSDHILSFIEASDPEKIFISPTKFTRIGGP